MEHLNPAKFWSKVEKLDGENACWRWKGDSNANGYGVIYGWRNGKRTVHMAHRYSFWLHNGYLTEGLVVMHSCDHPWCVAEYHISEGTVAENNADKERKGRGGQRSAERHNLAKLNWEQVRYIRELYATEEYSATELAEVFVMQHSSISKIVRNILWYDPDYTVPLFDNKHFQASKLSWDIVRQIRADFVRGLKNADLAAKYGVSPALVTGVIANKKWQDPNYISPTVKNIVERAASLSPREIQEIRGYASLGVRNIALATHYKTTDGNISAIVQRKTWKDILDLDEKQIQALPLFDTTPPVSGHPGLKGEEGTGSKTTWEQVRKIRVLYNSGKGKAEDLATKFGLSKSAVQRIINNETWVDTRYSPPVFDRSELRSNMTREKVAELRSEAGRGMTQRKMAEKYGISLAQVSAAVNNKTFTDPDYVPPLRPNIANAIREWHKVGRSIEEMQERFNQTPQTLVAVIENRHSYDPKYVPPHKEDAA